MIMPNMYLKLSFSLVLLEYNPNMINCQYVFEVLFIYDDMIQRRRTFLLLNKTKINLILL
jgi:hypothetical protein